MRDGLLAPGSLSRLVCLGGMSVAALLLIGNGAYGHQPNAPAVAETKALIDAGYPPLHSPAISTVELWRPNNNIVIWTGQYDGVDLETNAHSVRIAGDRWETRWLRELAAASTNVLRLGASNSHRPSATTSKGYERRHKI